MIGPRQIIANLVIAIGERIALYRTSHGWVLLLDTARRRAPKRCALGQVVQT